MRRLSHEDVLKWRAVHSSHSQWGCVSPPTYDRRTPDQPRLWFARLPDWNNPWSENVARLHNEDLAGMTREELAIERARMWLILVTFRDPHPWYRRRLERATEALRHAA